MAKLFTVRAENHGFLKQNTSSHILLHHITTTSASLRRLQLHPSPSKLNLKFRVICSPKREVRGTDNRIELLTGLRLDQDRARTVSDSESGFNQEIRSSGVGSGWNWPPWKNLPERYKLIGTTSLAFVICNMDKVNLSVAIIPMSHQFGWNSSVAGLVQSSFFWGYALSQLPGGWLAKLFGGRKVLQIGVLAWSVATAFVPLVAGYMPGLVLTRILVGIGEGVSPSAATDLIASSIPLEERSHAVAFVFGGLSVGSVTGLLLAPPLIQNFGWESIFYIFGVLGVVWFLGFQIIQERGNPSIRGSTPLYAGPHSVSTKYSGNTSFNELKDSLKGVPWKAFLKNQAVWAMIYAHFCGSWGHYTCLSWLPTYFSEELNLNLTEAAWDDEQESVFMRNKDGQDFMCYLPKVEKMNGGRTIIQQNTTGMIVETEERVKLKTPDELLEVLKDRCFIRVRIYRTGVCLGVFNAEATTAYNQNLSNVSTLRIPDQKIEQRYHPHQYTNGTVCDLTYRPRETEVRFVCSEPRAMISSITEISTCKYALTVPCPTLCKHSLFQEERPVSHIIYCNAMPKDNRESKVGGEARRNEIVMVTDSQSSDWEE